MEETYTLTVNGESQTIKMSFGMVNTLARLAGDIDGVGNIPYDSDLRDETLIALLSKRDKRGKVSEEFSIFAAEMDSDEVVGLLAWATEHVLDFFLKSAARSKDLGERRKDDLKALMPT